MIVDFLKNIFSQNKEKSTKKILEQYSMYLTPWYFKGSVPKLGKGLIWKQIKKLNGEKLALTGLYSENSCVGILDMYCYIKPLKNEQFLIWERGSRKIELYNSFDLKPIDINKIKWTDLNKNYLFNAQPVDSLEYYFDLYQTNLNFQIHSHK